VLWGAVTSAVLAGATWLVRADLPRIFIQDPTVYGIVQTAMLPACAMLAFSWNNALEGCLLGAGDATYVVNTYPWAVGFGLGFLALAYRSGSGLAGIWWALTVYYMALITWFGSRFVLPFNRGPM
jgi:Na+-driven multidrug efflux pump